MKVFISLILLPLLFFTLCQRMTSQEVEEDVGSSIKLPKKARENFPRESKLSSFESSADENFKRGEKERERGGQRGRGGRGRGRWPGRGDGGEPPVIQHVLTNARRGDAIDILEKFDNFSWSVQPIKSVGDIKGSILINELKKKKPKFALELGTFCGYSAVLIGSALAPADSLLISIDNSSEMISRASKIIKFAGLEEKVKLVEGTLSTVIKETMREFTIPAFDFVFIDHNKKLYLQDLKFLVDSKLLSPFAIVAADNILMPGAPDYREYLHQSSQFTSREIDTFLEYDKETKDIVMISSFVGYK